MIPFSKPAIVQLLPILFLSLSAAPQMESGGGPIDAVSRDTIPLDGRGGGVIAYAREPQGGGGVHEIFAMNADGTGDRLLMAASRGLNHHDWSPDGMSIAAVGYVSDDTWSIHLFGADGTGLTRITHEAGVWDTEPAWSPDGSMIAFSRILLPERSRSQIWVMRADGGEARFIGREGFAPRWSPDGTRLIYATSFRGPSDISTCALDGSDVRPLLSTPNMETNPSWSPDGARVLFISDRDGDREVFVMDADGKNQRQLTHNLVPEFVPRWSPDGSRIAFSSGLSGAGDHWEIFLIHPDGASLERITRTQAPMAAVNPAWRPGLR